ncbi:MAG UNVERIFIED_CONTAM: DUF721 domain-containing protein [Microcystis novacekii LVE1205-3]
MIKCCNYGQKLLIPVCWSKPDLFPSIRGVLSVATSSAALAQELSLQRYSLLKRLNSQLETPLSNIRFLLPVGSKIVSSFR